MAIINEKRVAQAPSDWSQCSGRQLPPQPQLRAQVRWRAPGFPLLTVAAAPVSLVLSGGGSCRVARASRRPEREGARGRPWEWQPGWWVRPPRGSPGDGAVSPEVASSTLWPSHPGCCVETLRPGAYGTRGRTGPPVDFGADFGAVCVHTEHLPKSPLMLVVWRSELSCCTGFLCVWQVWSLSTTR